MVWHDIYSSIHEIYSPHPYLKAFFAVGYITLFFDLLVLCYCFYERRYPPLKAKNLPLMGVLLVAYFCFWTGLAHSFGVLGWSGFLRNCFTFREYFEYPLGIHLFLFILCYRLLILYRLLVLRRPSPKWYRLGVVLAVYTPLLGGYALFDLLDAAVWFDDQHGLGCVPKLAWSIFSFSVVLLGLTALMFLNYSLRNTPPSLAVFHEYKETRRGSMIFLTFFVIISGVYFSGASQRFWGQATILILVFFMLNYYYWVVLFEPLTGCLFNRERTLQAFYERIGEITGQKSASTQRTNSQYRPSAGIEPPYSPLPRYSREGSLGGGGGELFKRVSTGPSLPLIQGSTVYSSSSVRMEAARPTVTTISSGEGGGFMATSLGEDHHLADEFPLPPPPLPPPPTVLRSSPFPVPVPMIQYSSPLQNSSKVSFGREVSYLSNGTIGRRESEREKEERVSATMRNNNKEKRGEGN